MSRSEYDLQSYAARLGSVLGPVTESREEAQKMAQQLSELAVDLGSFFNTTDAEAMQALRSGLTGEMESLKRYGVVINEATLQELAHKQGLKKKVAQMSVAEKTQLRYTAILESTKAAQGDAARTGEGFANASKALAAGLKDVGIRMAKTVIPAAEKLVRWARDGVTWFNKVSQESHVLEAAFITLAGVAGVLAIQFYGAFIPAALAVGALILLIDELWTTLEGGDTFLRDLMTESELKELQANLQAIKDLDMKAVWDSWAAAVDELAISFGRLVEKLLRLNPALQPFILAYDAYKALTGKDVEGKRTTGRGMGAPLATDEQVDAQRRAERDASIRAGFESREKARAERAREEKYGPRVFSAVPATQDAYVPGFDMAAASGGTVNPAVNLAAPTIIINGGDEAKVKRVVTETMEAERKKTMAAVGRRGGGS